FIRDEQQRHAGGLVDAAALGLDDAVLDLVARAHAVASTDRVRLVNESDSIRVLDTVDGDRAARVEGDSDLFGGDLDIVAPRGNAHDGVDNVEPFVEVLEEFRLVGGPPDVRVGAVR